MNSDILIVKKCHKSILINNKRIINSSALMKSKKLGLLKYNKNKIKQNKLLLFTFYSIRVYLILYDCTRSLCLLKPSLNHLNLKINMPILLQPNGLLIMLLNCH